MIQTPKICSIDVTANCTNNDTVDAYNFVNMTLFAKENNFFLHVLRQRKFCKIVIKSSILGNGPVYHSTDYHKYKG